jgi:ferredoxin-NADP reductase
VTDAALRSPPSSVKGITAISLRARLVFDSHDDVLLGVFSETDNGNTLHPAYLPPESILVEWVRRSIARHPQLETFKLVVEYNTFHDNFPIDERMLEFEYQEAKAHPSVYQPPPLTEKMDLRNQRAEADARQYRYTIYPAVVQACHDRLVKEAETTREQDALEEADVEEDLEADAEPIGAAPEDGAT